MNAVSASTSILRIEPSHGWVAIKIRELWHSRELLYFLTLRDIKIRYKQTALGIGWAVLQPLLTMLIFTVIFGRIAKMPSDGVSYPVFALSGLVPWTFFAYGLTQASNSMVASANMVKKVYFPRLTIPLSTVLSGLVDLVFAFLLLLVLMFIKNVTPTANIIWIPLFVLLAFATSLGVGLWFAALNVRYRDVRYLVPFIVQFWMYATPIAYPSSVLKSEWRIVFALNPMTGVVEGFRWALVGSNWRPGPELALSATVAVMVLVTGALYFKRMERTFADVV